MPNAVRENGNARTAGGAASSFIGKRGKRENGRRIPAPYPKACQRVGAGIPNVLPFPIRRSNGVRGKAPSALKSPRKRELAHIGHKRIRADRFPKTGFSQNNARKRGHASKSCNVVTDGGQQTWRNNVANKRCHVSEPPTPQNCAPFNAFLRCRERKKAPEGLGTFGGPIYKIALKSG